MKLFAVRCIEDKQAVGFFWVRDLKALWWMVDAVIDPGACEYCRVNTAAAVMWSDDAPAIGVGRKDEILDGEALARGASFEFGFEDVLYGEVKGGWKRMVGANEPGGGIEQLRGS